MIAVALLVLGILPRCAAGNLWPDPKCTPGVSRWDVTASDVCRHLYRPRLPATVRRRVIVDYGIAPGEERRYAIDHLVPIELGGANVAENLWPELWLDSKRKDVVENRVRRDVCAGKVKLEDAQAAFARDWTTLE